MNIGIARIGSRANASLVIFIFAIVAFASSVYAPPARAQAVDRVLNEQAGANKDAAASQQRIDQLADQTQDMLAKYRQAVSDAESLKKYNEQLVVQVKSQSERMANMNPLERLGTPEDIAASVAFLAGPDGGWINGQVLRANGGMI